MFSNPGAGLLEMDTVLQLFDARLLIEPHLTDLAARHGSEAEFQELTDIVAEGKQALAEHGDHYLQTNKQFHTVIGRASKNLVLAQTVESMVELYSTELERVDPTHTLEEVRNRDHRAHLEITEAIAKRDADVARQAMIDHLTVARTSVEDRIAIEASLQSEAT